MPYTLPPLPYEANALEPHIDVQTMQIHHDKHHQAYIDKLNAALVGHDDLIAMSIEDLLRNFVIVPQDIQAAIKNHGGGHSNHSIFWTLLTPKKQDPTPTLKEKIVKAFGTWEDFVSKFNLAATSQFGSGWAWLIKKNDGTLEVKGYPNQDSPYMENATPILGIDIWEHAYYLKYQNRRPEYITAFWNVINWSEVEKRLGM